MRRFFHTARLLIAACLLTACTPARTGVIGNTLTTNVKPGISITGALPLAVHEHGRILAQSGPPSAEGNANLTVDFALFADTAASQRFAFAAIIRITNDTQWHFQPPTAFAGAFSEGRQIVGGFHWSEQLLKVASGEDWIDGIWEDTGGKPAEIWLVKRWVTHLTNTARAVMEYREPWPAALRLLPSGTPIVNDEADAAFRLFLARADAAFIVEKKRGQFEPDSPASRTIKPRIPLDAVNTIGTVIRLHNN